MKFKFIDLFAGVGGFRMALQNLDGHCVFSSEWNQHAKETYFQNYGEYPEGDITLNETKAKIPESFDILCGGFPCQAFSIAGNQKGFNETRGTLFFDIVDIAKKHQPKVVFLENVKNLVSHDKGNTFEVIKNTLKEIGYAVYFQVLNSMTHANVPQNRERIFIVAFNEALVPNHAEFQFPEAIPLTKTIHDFLETKKVDQKYYYKPDHMYYPTLKESMTSRDTLYQWRRVYVRENKSGVCPTLTANMGAGGHNVPLIRDAYGIRKLTPKECFAFQGYPVNVLKMPEIADSHLYMQAGNSVTMPLIQRIAEQILEVLIKNLKKGGVMDIQKEKHNYLAMLVAEDAITQEQCSDLSLYNGGNYFHSEFLASSRVDCINWGWSAWLKAKTQAVPKGFVLVPAESLKVALFWMNEDIDPWQMGGDSFADLFEHKPILEKVLIEAQEQGHG
ncbi:DNA cytosine methyltransferase [Acinetobacter cumulans]|uniref:DNA cytosine methyltransferase n=1 Tax=Acinetobacter cumulans TaxID=2136182 RepID=UPI000EA368F0|nr:DNA cytosine methyltransferase [Acinetobacter cumulans]RKG45926.1 DNA cytosine methyltransferase [Acinetobacter cumulans]